MSSHFTAIGFPVREMREYWALARRAAQSGERVFSEGGRVLIRWAPGGGPQIWAQTSAAGEVINATPFFATDHRYRVAVTASGASDDDGFEGWIDGWLNPTEDDEPYSGAFPLRVDLVNYAAARARLREGAVVPLRLAVILHEASLYSDAAAYGTVKDVAYRPPIKSFTSSVHFGVDEPAEGDATALITGVLGEARLLTNPATDAAFWWMRVETANATLPLLGDRDVLPLDPRAGQVIECSGWVLGEALAD
jgi:hypothetical protein